MADQTAEPIERWTAKRRVALVVSIVKGETSGAEAARCHGLTVAAVEDWRERFWLGAENALRTRPKEDEALKDERIKAAPGGPRRSVGSADTWAHSTASDIWLSADLGAAALLRGPARPSHGELSHRETPALAGASATLDAAATRARLAQSGSVQQ